jgi:hypothetical protein
MPMSEALYENVAQTIASLALTIRCTNAAITTDPANADLYQPLLTNLRTYERWFRQALVVAETDPDNDDELERISQHIEPLIRQQRKLLAAITRRRHPGGTKRRLKRGPK